MGFKARMPSPLSFKMFTLDKELSIYPSQETVFNKIKPVLASEFIALGKENLYSSSSLNQAIRSDSIGSIKPEF